MDTLIFLVSVAVVVILGYGVFWTVRAVRRVGLRRFAGALGALVWAVFVAIRTLFVRERSDEATQRGATRIAFVDALNDVLDAEEAQRLSDEGSRIGSGHHS